MRLEVGVESHGQRLDIFLRTHLPGLSRVQLQKAVKEGNCKIAGALAVNAAQKVWQGQQVEFMPPAVCSELVPESGEAPVIWSDAYLAVCAKPPYLTTHPCPSCPENTLIQRLLTQFPTLASQGGQRPGIVHRLDKDTSGLLLIALESAARARLAEAFARREVHKEYLALVAGKPPEAGECHEPLGRDPKSRTRMAIVRHGGRSAKSTWRRLWHSETGDFSLVAVKIFSGRTHQIRTHFQYLGFPLLGDKLYAPPEVGQKAPRQMLHAWKLAFAHPITGSEMRFQLPPPADFLNTILGQSHYVPLVVITGNPGCGKSSFCKYLAEKGLPYTSADAIVARLYAEKGALQDWISHNLPQSHLISAGKVDKSALFALLEASPRSRHEFENYVHALVLAEIKAFWHAHQGAAAPCVIAEIPLYFECGWEELISPRPLAIGVDCPRELRWRRIAKSRGWTPEKIATLESWQWGEERKMRACDLVVANDGDEAQLFARADEVIQLLQKRQEGEQNNLADKMRALWGREPTIEICGNMP